MIMDRRRETGRCAEEAAESLLRRAGLKILERNFRCRLAEVDIIARDGDTLVFVEVRSHTTDFLADPAQTITRAKQDKVILGARHYLARISGLQPPVRFDVVSVRFVNRSRDIRWIRGAFRPEGLAV